MRVDVNNKQKQYIQVKKVANKKKNKYLGNIYFTSFEYNVHTKIIL